MSGVLLLYKHVYGFSLTDYGLELTTQNSVCNSTGKQSVKCDRKHLKKENKNKNEKTHTHTKLEDRKRVTFYSTGEKLNEG